MEMLEVRFTLGVDELLDAAEDIQLLLDREGDSDLSPAFRDLLFTLDETITEAYRKRSQRSVPVPVDDAVSGAVTGAGGVDRFAGAGSALRGGRRELVETRRVANKRVRQLAEDVSENPHAQTWMFFCECGNPGCNALVPLVLDEFDRMAAQRIDHVLDEHRAAAAASTRDA